MDMDSFAPLLRAYWSPHELTINVIVFMNLLGALLLGALVGYERAYHGRAAGMRTYGLVCMASAGLTVVAGYPGMWFGGGHALATVAPDPTRVIQGIVTGIGFLGAGVIVKEGLNISGLTTAASIWAASCIGVLVGVGFYAAAILLAGLSSCIMMWGGRMEGWLPSHPAVSVTLRFLRASMPAPEVRDRDLDSLFRGAGYEIAAGSFAISGSEAQQELKFVIVALDKRRATSINTLADLLGQLGGVTSLSLSHARN